MICFLSCQKTMGCYSWRPQPWIPPTWSWPLRLSSKVRVPASVWYPTPTLRLLWALVGRQTPSPLHPSRFLSPSVHPRLLQSRPPLTAAQSFPSAALLPPTQPGAWGRTHKATLHRELHLSPSPPREVEGTRTPLPSSKTSHKCDHPRCLGRGMWCEQRECGLLT